MTSAVSECAAIALSVIAWSLRVRALTWAVPRSFSFSDLSLMSSLARLPLATSTPWIVLFLICPLPIEMAAYELPPSAMNSAAQDVTLAKVRCGRILDMFKPLSRLWGHEPPTFRFLHWNRDAGRAGEPRASTPRPRSDGPRVRAAARHRRDRPGGADVDRPLLAAVPRDVRGD